MSNSKRLCLDKDLKERIKDLKIKIEDREDKIFKLRYDKDKRK